MTSTRLPGKVLAPVEGYPLLAHQIRRVRACQSVDDILIATTTNAADEPIVDLARQQQVGCFRGSEHDVLSRYVGAARQAGADVIVRLTSDCPLIDPHLIDHAIDLLIENAADCDYVSNVIQRTYPRGLDVEAFFLDVLLRLDRMGHSASAREHVTVFLRSERPEWFRLRHILDTQDNSDLRWTVDTQVDLDLVRTLYHDLNLTSQVVPYPEILAHVRSNPELAQMNAHVETWTPHS